jgi:hypothetical protein
MQLLLAPPALTRCTADEASDEAAACFGVGGLLKGAARVGGRPAGSGARGFGRINNILLLDFAEES